MECMPVITMCSYGHYCFHGTVPTYDLVSLARSRSMLVCSDHMPSIWGAPEL
jgi:GH43 family beta-xylosidase